jgi:hypothetical protein
VILLDSFITSLELIFNYRLYTSYFSPDTHGTAENMHQVREEELQRGIHPQLFTIPTKKKLSNLTI